MPSVGSNFSGVGGFELGLERAGFHVAYQAEADPFCQRVLARRWPSVRRFADVRHVADEPVDLLVGGFPCQDLSPAGHRAGLRGARSGLFFELPRIARAGGAPWALLENVDGLLSSHAGRDMGVVLARLRECWPAVGWRVLDSQYFGVPQRRRRVFLVCGPDEAHVAAALFERPGGAGDLGARAAAGPHDPAGSGGGPAGGRRVGPLLAAQRGAGWRSDTLAAHGTVSAAVMLGAVPIADKSSAPGRRRTAGGARGLGIGADGGPSYALEARPNHPPMVGTGDAVRRLTPVECERLQGFPDGWTCLCQELDAYREDPEEAALRCRCPDGPRYRAMGNAVTVNVVEWLGRRLVAAMGS